MTRTTIKTRSFIYSCFGSSNAAPIAKYLGLQRGRKGIGEKCCIAGVVRNVKSIEKTAKSGRKIIAIDGNMMACSKLCHANYNLFLLFYFDLIRWSINKNQHIDFDIVETTGILAMSRRKLSINQNPGSHE